MAYYFEIRGSQAVSAEGYYPMSVISNQAFSINVIARNRDGTVDTNYNGSATIYANSETSDTAYQLGTLQFSQGYATSGSLIIRSVLGTGSGRKITVTNGVITGSISTGVWFQVPMTVECPYGTSSQPYGYTQQTSCGPQPAGKAFVALPAVVGCGVSVVVHVPNGGTVTVPIEDVGPYNTNDPYWNGTGIPANTQNGGAGIDGSDGTWNALGLTNYSCSYSNPYGNQTVQWRFQ